MKIAKKLLAAVIAVMLVCSLTVCAFASSQSAETGDVKIESDWVIDEYGTISLYVYFVDAVELQSWDLIVTYDADMFAYDEKSAGVDAKNITLYCNPDKNTFTDESNGGVAGEIKCGGYFKEVLWDAATFAAAANRGETLTVNSDKFNASIFYLRVLDVEKFNSVNTTISIAGSMKFGAKVEGQENAQVETQVSDSISHIVEVPTEPTEVAPTEVAPTEVQPTEVQPTEVQPTEVQPTEVQPTEVQPTEVQPTEVQPTEVQPTEPATRPTEDDDDRPGHGAGDNDRPGNGNNKPGNDNNNNNKPGNNHGKPEHNHPNTGDSAALAAAAGVVLLAGAAFVVSKKRK